MRKRLQETSRKYRRNWLQEVTEFIFTLNQDYPIVCLLTLNIDNNKSKSKYYFICVILFLKNCLNLTLLYVVIVEVQNSRSCNSRVHAYKNGKTMEDCRQQAKKTTELLSEEISNRGEVSWTRILEVTDYDELIYKLTLKYLRQKGYDIGNNKIPRVK